VAPLRSAPFETFAGVCAILSGVIGFLYAVAFVVLQHILLSGLFLMLGGLLSTAVLAAVYDRLRETEASFALWALLLGIAGALGSAVHGGYDLANAINPPPSIPDLPNPRPADSSAGENHPLDVRRTLRRCYRSLAEICWQGRRWTSTSQTPPRMRQTLVRILKSCANDVRRRCDNVGRRHCGDRPQYLRAVQRP
jgi:hypothetical protein